MKKKKVFQAAVFFVVVVFFCFFFCLEEDLTVEMDGIDIGYVRFNLKHEELLIIYISGAPCKSTHSRKFGNHLTVHRPPVRL